MAMPLHNPHQHQHHLKRLQHSTNSSDLRFIVPSNDEALRETIERFSASSINPKAFYRPFKPAPNQARRGGGRSSSGRHWYSSVSLPKRTINYDLAESFMDHSTNPLSSDLYKIRFKHSIKQWPNGRFINYKEKLDKLDGNITDLLCTRTFPIVPKRKRIREIEQKRTDSTIPSASKLVLENPMAQEQKKKLVNKQTNLYNNLFGCGKIPKLPSASQIKKINGVTSSTKSLLEENKEDQQC